MSAERFVVVDRIEDQNVVLVTDDEQEFVVPRYELQVGVNEGTVLRVTFGGGQPLWGSARLDPQEQARRIEEARRKLDELRKRDPGGDLEL